MNRAKGEKKYVFKPPMYSPLIAPLIHWISDYYFLKHKYKVVKVDVRSGMKELKQRYKNGDSLLVTPNHSDHCDPHVFMHLSRKFNVPVNFMAAREIFERNKSMRGPLLQLAGVFSIDRDGSDLKAIKEAVHILCKAEYPLVMFPEGEIYHLNEKLTPLNEGAATLALMAARKVKKEKNEKSVLIVPTALRYVYSDDIASTFSSRMDRLERSILWKPQAHLDIVNRIYKFGEAALSLKEKEYLDRTLAGSLNVRLSEFREILISREEEQYFKEVSNGNHPVRIRKLRGKIRSILLDGDPPSDETVARCCRSLDNLYFAIQLYSYPGQYLKEKPSSGRIEETIHKFEEDAFEENVILGERRVEVTFCDPINMMDYLSESRSSAAEVTTLMETAIREVLER